VTGGSGADFLYGNALNNVILGGAGIDRLEGRAGNETYVFDTDTPWDAKTIVENIADVGYDMIDFSGTTLFAVDLNLSILGSPQTININLTLTIMGEGIEEVRGGAMNDTIRGNSNTNVLRGGLGNDLLDGKSGVDLLDGGLGNDDLNGGTENDFFIHTANASFTLTNTQLMLSNGEVDTLDNIENAFLTGGSSANTFTLTGWTGNAILDGAGNAVDAFGMAADVNFILTNQGANGVRITLSTGKTIDLLNVEEAMLTGGPGINMLDASALTLNAAMLPRIHLTLSGGNGNDTIKGSLGNDILLGGLGNDMMTGNRGNDLIDGGTGTDTLIEDLTASLWTTDFVLTNTFLVIVQHDPTPLPTDETINEGDVLSGIENATLTGTGQDDIFDVSAWSAGALTINAAGGNDTVKSTMPGAGTLTLTNTGLTYTDTNGNSSAAPTTFSAVEVVYLYGSSGDDVIDASTYTGSAALIGNDGNDTLKAGSGTNLLNGGAGDDLLVFKPDGLNDIDLVIGGAGDDTLDFSAFAASVVINLSVLGAFQTVVVADQRIIISVESGPLVEEIENLIGGSGADTLTGNALNNRITGNGGADNINGLGGPDTLVEARDTHFTLTNVSLTDGGGTVDTLSNIERAELTGGTSNNNIDASAFLLGPVTLSGGDGADTLKGGSSSDVLIGGAGDDVLVGGNGADTYRFDVDLVLGQDTVDEAAAPAGGIDLLDFRETTMVGITVDLSNPAQQTVHATNMKLTLTSNSSIEYLAGGDRNDILTGNTLDNVFIAGLGNDIVRGGTGINYILESRAGVVGHEDDNFALVTTSATTASLTIGTEVDVLRDIQNVFLGAGSGNNTMDASQFTNGAVSLSGGDGNDVLIGGYKDDFLNGGNGNDTLYGGGGADTLSGEEGDDTLNGCGNIDTTIGTDGNDSLDGGNGSDTYLFDITYTYNTTTMMYEFIFQGTDSIFDSGGAHDQIFGLGLSGIDVDLSSALLQKYETPDFMLILGLMLPANQIENSFP
jgi:Ca2+-binding RTX toxin-like protein